MRKNFIFLACLFIPTFSLSYTVCLDPGHGGTDPGATGTDYTEKQANLDVALKLKGYLISWAIDEVRMTRDSDINRSPEDRVKIAEGTYWDPPKDPVERFISIHHNAWDKTVQGTETYCHPSASSNAVDLRNKTHPYLVQAFEYPDRGVKTKDFYVLENTKRGTDY